MSAAEVGTALGPVRIRVTRADLVRYAGASTDFNPIHYSDRAAATLGLPGVLAHGMWTMGVALRVVTDWVGDPSRIRSYSVRFTKPVVVPDDDEGAEVVVTGTVTAATDSTATISLDVTANGEKVLGNATVEVAL